MCEKGDAVWKRDLSYIGREYSKDGKNRNADDEDEDDVRSEVARKEKK
jgi:hypothetical protein